MNARFNIEISGDLVAAIPRIKNKANWSQAMARRMDQQNQITVSSIQMTRLNGKGPFPVAEHRLGVRTHRLINSLNASKAVILGTGVVSSIGTNVTYAKAHEFGAVIQRTVKAGSVKLLTNKRGELLTRGNLATFARTKKHVRKLDSHFKEVQFHGGKSYTITIPARAPVGHGIADRLPEYTAAFDRVTTDYLEGKN